MKIQFSLSGNVNNSNLEWNIIASGTMWETSGEIHRELHYWNLCAEAQLSHSFSYLYPSFNIFR